jgi:hypothetical protein
MRFGSATQRERTFPNRFVGDFNFDLERDQYRSLLFLHRNVMRVLAHHAKRRARSKANSNASANNAPTTSDNPAIIASKPNTKRNYVLINGSNLMTNSSVTPHSAGNHSGEIVMPGCETSKLATPQSAPDSKRSSVRKQLEGIYRQQGAELLLELKNIRKKLNFTSNRRNDGEPDKKRIKRDVVRCQCHVAIWDNREVFRSPEPVVTRSQLCSVTLQGGPEDCQSVDIEMDCAFRIKATEMHVPVKTKGGIQMTWGDKYFLEVKIIPCEEAEVWPPFKVLSKVEGTVSAVLGKRSAATVQGALVSSYANLPQAPASNVPLSISFVQDGLTLKTKFGLEVSSTWAIPTANEMKIKTEENEWLNKVPFWTPKAKQPSLPVAGAALTNGARSENRPKKVVVSYRLDVAGSTIRSREFRDACLDGYSCVACRRREYQSLTDLLFHLSTCHFKYKYTVEEEERNPVPGEPQHIVIKVDVADPEKKKPLKKTFKNPDTEIDWVAPKRPFDVDAYLNGDHTWTGHGHKKPVKAPRPALNGASASTSAFPKRKAGFTPAEEVQEIPIPERKRFKVIPSRTRNNTSFFRSVSHRPMRLIESPLSESDDEMDDSWIQDKHRERIYEQDDLDDIEKEFLARWDLHVMAEHCPQGRYISDSLVRFVRKERMWLRQTDIWRELQKLIRELKEHDVVDSKVIAGCFKILWRDGAAEAGTKTDGDSETNSTHPNGATVTFGNGDRGPGRPYETLEGSRSPENGNAVDMGDLDHSQPVREATHDIQPLPIPGSCGICSEPNVRKRKTIACGGAVSLDRFSFSGHVADPFLCSSARHLE